MPYTGVRVEGLKELNRALRKVNDEVRRGLRGELLEASEPVRSEAERLAVSEIRNVGPVWYRMRKGASGLTVYVAPATRRSGGSPRPNFGRLLMKEAMEPALDAKRGEVISRVERVLDRAANSAGF